MKACYRLCWAGVVVGLAFLLWRGVYAQPVIVASHHLILPAHDCDAVIEAELPITNAGKSTLSITEFSSECSCVQVNQESVKEIAPGKSSALRLRIQTPRAEGKWVKSGVFKTNDPNNKLFQFSVESEAEQNVRLFPPVLALGSGSPDKVYEIRVKTAEKYGAIQKVDLPLAGGLQILGATTRVLSSSEAAIDLVVKHMPSGELDLTLPIQIVCANQSTSTLLKVGGTLNSNIKASSRYLIIRRDQGPQDYRITVEGQGFTQCSRISYCSHKSAEKDIFFQAVGNTVSFSLGSDLDLKSLQGGVVFIYGNNEPFPIFCLPVYVHVPTS